MALSVLSSMIFGAARTAGLMSATAAGAVGDVKATWRGQAEAGQAAMAGAGRGARMAGRTVSMTAKLAEKSFGLQKTLFMAANPAKMGKAAVEGPVKMVGFLKKIVGKGAGMMGISLSVSSLLRQSQLFTGLVGALFQVLGGFVDVILAPFMPYLFKVVSMLAQQIPTIRKWAQKVHDWLANNVFPIIAEWAGKISNKIVDVWNWFKETLWPPLEAIGHTIWEGITEITGFFKTTIWPPLEGFITDTYAKLKEGFESVTDLFSDISVDVVAVKDKVVGEIEKVMLWFKDNILPVVEKLRDTVIDTLVTVITEAKDLIVNTIWPRLQNIFKSFDENIVPVLKEAAGYALELVDALIDVIQPLFELILIPLFKAAYKVMYWFLDKILGILFRLIRFLWDYVIKWVVKLAIWILRKLPAIIENVANFITGFLKFDWLKSFVAHILSAVLWLVEALGKIKFVDTSQAQANLTGIIAQLKGTKAGSAAQQIKVEVVTNIDGLQQPSAQENWDIQHGNVTKMTKGINLGGEVAALDANFSMIG